MNNKTTEQEIWEQIQKLDKELLDKKIGQTEYHQKKNQIVMDFIDNNRIFNIVTKDNFIKKIYLWWGIKRNFNRNKNYIKKLYYTSLIFKSVSSYFGNKKLLDTKFKNSTRKEWNKIKNNEELIKFLSDLNWETLSRMILLDKKIFK